MSEFDKQEAERRQLEEQRRGLEEARAARKRMERMERLAKKRDDNYMRTVEDLLEGNDNMLDGILNGEVARPAADAQVRDGKESIRERLSRFLEDEIERRGPYKDAPEAKAHQPTRDDDAPEHAF